MGAFLFCISCGKIAADNSVPQINETIRFPYIGYRRQKAANLFGKFYHAADIIKNTAYIHSSETESGIMTIILYIINKDIEKTLAGC